MRNYKKQAFLYYNRGLTYDEFLQVAEHGMEDVNKRRVQNVMSKWDDLPEVTSYRSLFKMMYDKEGLSLSVIWPQVQMLNSVKDFVRKNNVEDKDLEEFLGNTSFRNGRFIAKPV